MTKTRAEITGHAASHRVFQAQDEFDNPGQLADLLALHQHDGVWRNQAAMLNLAGTMLGGHIIALGLKAAHQQAGGAVPVALHVLLLAGPNPQEPSDFPVDPIRDGRRFVHRGGAMVQSNRTCARFTATFAHPPLGQGLPYDGKTNKAPCVPAPETLPTRQQVLDTLPTSAGRLRRSILRGFPFLDIREVPCAPDANGMGMFWLRVPDANALSAIDHYCLLALISDFWFPLPLHNVADCMNNGSEDMPLVSLDHALWFHTQPNCADWMLFRMQASASGGGLGTSQGEAWNRAGQPIANFMQLGLTA